MSILDKIINKKREEVRLLQGKKWELTHTKKVPTFRELISNSTTINIIAEIKRSSPSKGAIQMNIDPSSQAKQYESLGAKAISVLTDQTFFNGSIDDLIAVRKAVDIPILCKDFMIDPLQIDQAKSAGATIILLIVAALEQNELTTLYHYAKEKNLEVLCEVHNEAEMERALHLGAKIIGINNRDLNTFTVDLQTTHRLATMVQDQDITLVSESGIRTRADVVDIQEFGAESILVGETLMRSTDLQATFNDLLIPLRSERR